MSAGYICDRCGAAIFVGERTVMKLWMQNPEGEVVGTIGRGPNDEPIADLCLPCGNAVATIIANRIMTKASNPEVFVDGRK